MSQLEQMFHTIRVGLIWLLILLTPGTVLAIVFFFRALFGGKDE